MSTKQSYELTYDFLLYEWKQFNAGTPVQGPRMGFKFCCHVSAFCGTSMKAAEMATFFCHKSNVLLSLWFKSTIGMNRKKLSNWLKWCNGNI